MQPFKNYNRFSSAGLLPKLRQSSQPAKPAAAPPKCANEDTELMPAFCSHGSTFEVLAVPGNKELLFARRIECHIREPPLLI
jgi:hypothetical protein